MKIFSNLILPFFMIVAFSSADAQTISDEAWSASRTSGIPSCSSSASDTDGDGWGWENSATCKVVEEEEDLSSDNNATETNDLYEQDDNYPGLIEPSPGTQILSQNFELHARVSPESHRYKIFIGSELIHNDLFKQKIATKNYFDSNFQEVKNGLISQSISLSDSVQGRALWITVVSFIKDRSPVVKNYKFDAEIDSDNTNIPQDQVPDEDIAVTTGCFNPWASGGMNLENRVRRLMENPYRTGFGGDATGGTKRLVVVSNPAASGSGSFADVISKASPGDFIVFDPKHDVYMNGCDRGGCKVPGDVTIDGSLSNGKFVELVNRQSDTYYGSLIFRNGNNILTNIKIEHDTLAGAVHLSNGKNYWLDAFEIRAYQDDALGIGDAVGDPNNSADLITVSRYRVHGGPKGILMNVGGQSCQDYPLKDFESDTDWGGGVPTDIAINQRRARVTIINSDLAAGTRNILNKGGYADIIGSYIHGRVENTTTKSGGQTIVRCSYIDSRKVLYNAGISIDEGFFAVGKNKAGARFCPQQSEAFLDGNVYRQVDDLSAESTNPRINVSGSTIKTRKGGYITDGIANWSNPPSGRSAFSRHYENDVQQFCSSPAPSSVAGPEFVVKEHCN